MDLTSSPKPGGFSSSDCSSDPEEKEISDDDDDDRNHKHRRRESQPQSLEKDALEQVLIRPYRKRKKPFESVHSFRENNSQPSETWKNYNSAPLEKDFSAKFERRRTGLATFPRAPLDLNQRIRANKSSFGEPVSGRGRGRETVPWTPSEPWFSSVDIASQMVQQGPMPPSIFASRGLQNVSNAQGPSWSAYGLIPGVANGGLDTLHSLGLQGTLRPTINHPLNIGIPRQRCRDFEERGFCLRGDMCPMEHGVNRIVVEDVQSLSQFNLPVSLPSAHLLGAPAGPGPLGSVSTPSSMMNGKGSQRKNGQPGMADGGLGLNGSFSGSASAAGADVYDPDEPLWTNDRPEASTGLLTLNPSKIDEAEPMLDIDPSDRHHVRFSYGSDNDCAGGSNATAGGSQSLNLSVWGRIGSSKDDSDVTEKIDISRSTSNHIEVGAKEDDKSPISLPGAVHQGRRSSAEDTSTQYADSSLKTKVNSGRSIRKPSQKALRTLFVNGIPQNNNKREALLSHFRKFGEVIDIYIPLNSERAFVQFSKREEAEAALTSPDAVMGNRFIKLWWANRDSIHEEGTSGGNNVSFNSSSVAVTSVLPGPSTQRGKDILQSATPKVSITPTNAPPPVSDHYNPVATNSPKAPPPPLPKKHESLELLKELRKKQEMLDQKRNDFRRQLDKLEKQATGLKGEVVPQQAAKRHKVGLSVEAETPRTRNTSTLVASPGAEVTANNKKSSENVHHSPKTNATATREEPSSLKPSIRPLAPAGAPFIMNRFKLDNRPTTFKIIPPLPSGLADVAALKEHFSTYGELSTVVLEGSESNDSEASESCYAHVTFTTRHSAERAFLNGKFWRGNNLQFMWLTSSNSHSDKGGKENPPSVSKESADVNMQPAGEVASVSQEVAPQGNEKSEKVERRNSDEKDLEGEEIIQISERSCKGQSP